METFIRSYQIDDSICDDLLQFARDNQDWSKKGSTSQGIDTSWKDSRDLVVNKFAFDNRVKVYVDEIKKCFELYKEEFDTGGFPGKVEFFHYFNIQKYEPDGGFKKWHSERSSIKTQDRCLVFMTYLNTLNDPGGETEFLYQNVKVRPEKGLTLLWPSDFTHTHRGVVSHTEVKYIATGWLTLGH